MTSSSELAPCPFCGAEMDTEVRGSNRTGQTTALRHQLNDCLLSGYGWGLLSHKAKWNRRAAEAGKEET